MAKELLLEIGTEELPAGYIPPVLESLGAVAETGLREARLGFETIQTLGTPRRLVLRAIGVADKQEDLVEQQQGPARSVAFDENGHPTKAAKGFAQGRGVAVEDLVIQETSRGEYVFATVLTPGRSAEEILSSLLPELVGDLSFPKSMRWGAGEIRFARPIRWLLALLDDKIISFTLGEITSGDKTYGHRQLSPGPFQVRSAEAYLDVLAKTGIIVDHQSRRATIWNALKKAAAEEGGQPLADEGLLDVVTFLVEMPTAFCGRFDERYLSLPCEVLTTAMSEHQKYFAVIDDQDELLPLFLAVGNGDPQYSELIMAGNEKVLTARLEDAKYFFEEDQKTALIEKVDMLKQVVFQEDLGTLYEKTERIEALTHHLADALHLSKKEEQTACRAARLCKADLVTHMVGEKEFSKLQGYMGQHYALVSGEAQPVARAIYEHYLPRFAEDCLPETLPGSLVAIADKLDTIAGCYGVGLIPTGSQDPYALRRSALGVVRILLNGELAVDLDELVDQALDLLADRLRDQPEEVKTGILSFFRQRMEGQLVEAGLDQDVVDAVLSADARDILKALRRGSALQAFRAEEGFELLVQGSKRVANILRQQEVAGQTDPALLREDAERTLFRAAQEAGEKIARQVRAGDHRGALQTTLDLVAPIDAFFDEILVMDKEQKVRKNRLRLLAQIREIFLSLADYSKIVNKGEMNS